MRVTLLDDDNVSILLDIIFWKTAPGERRKENGKELIDTYCQISRVIPGQPAILFTQTEARQNPIDNFNKIVGRKIALDRAIDKLAFLKSKPEDGAIHHRHRKMRRRIWEVFHQTFGRWS